MRILVTAERTCFPLTEKECEDFPPPDLCFSPDFLPYRYLNSGGWMGEARDVLAVLHAIEEKYPRGLEAANMNDQAAMQYLFANKTSRVKLGMRLDYTNQIFQAMHMSAPELVIMRHRVHNRTDNQRPLPWRECNVLTGGCPALLHFNGGSKDLQKPRDDLLHSTAITLGTFKSDRITRRVNQYVPGGLNMSVATLCCSNAWTSDGLFNKKRPEWLRVTREGECSTAIN